MKALITVRPEWQDFNNIVAKLEEQGYETHVQKYAFEDFPFADVVSEKYDLIVIDNDIESEDQSYPGLEIVRKLRAEHRTGTPCVVFNLNIEEIEHRRDKGKLEFLNITYSPGLILLDKKDNVSELDKVGELKPLSRAAVADVVEMLLDVRGYLLDMITHKLMFIEETAEKAKDIEEESLNNLNSVEIIIDRHFTVSEKMRIEFPKYKDSLHIAQLKFEKDEYYKLRQELRDKCEIELESRKSVPSKKDSKERLKILLLDDDPDWLKKFENYFADSFEIVSTTSGNEAITILSSDENSDIHGVVADWRIYKDFRDTSKWQEVQGYDILDYAAKNSSRALIALTSLTDAIVHKIRNELNLNITLITKDYVDFENNTNLFKNIITEKCNEAAVVRASLPDGKRWTEIPNKAPYRSLRKQYLEIFNSGDWRTFESEKITQIADLLWSNYKKCLGVFNRSYNAEINKINDIYSQYGLSESKYELRDILILRRIWLALWFNRNNIYLGSIDRDAKYKKYEMAGEKVFLLLKGRSFFEFYLDKAKEEKYAISKKLESKIKSLQNLDKYQKQFDDYKQKNLSKKELELEDKTEFEIAFERLNRDSKQVISKLCITIKNLPLKGILPEEKNWLYKIGIDIEKGNPTPELAEEIADKAESSSDACEDPLSKTSSEAATPEIEEITEEEKERMIEDTDSLDLDEDEQ